MAWSKSKKNRKPVGLGKQGNACLQFRENSRYLTVLTFFLSGFAFVLFNNMFKKKKKECLISPSDASYLLLPSLPRWTPRL